MGEVYFYHLTESPLEAILPTLITRARGQGWRIEVRGSDPARIARLDEFLWLGSDEGFLPHGLAGGPHDRLQPVILTVAGQPVQDMACLMAVDGAAIDPAEAGALQRSLIVFDGNDAAALARARDQWRSMTGAGIGAKYWAQDDGRWVMKQERAASA